MTMTLISTVTVGAGGAATVQFSSIPQTFTDLSLAVSARGSYTSQEDGLVLNLNGLTSGYTYRYLYGNGASAGSGTNNYSINDTGFFVGALNSAGSTTNTFSSHSIYLPNYTSAATKTMAADTTQEQNGSTAWSFVISGAVSTGAITSISLKTSTAARVILENSVISLYGITKGSGGATVS